ncbi:hypothetical protein B0H14DRAFT_3579403 [Mycena olivaceomarginata]|nr:hypothetical protein B0H14DRAFT_3579403 [Mycena olivaceomarginata]
MSHSLAEISHLGVDAQHHSGFANDVASHAYAHQLINGIIVSLSNAVTNVAFNTDDRPLLLVLLSSNLVSEIPSTVEYLAKDNGEVVLVHVLQSLADYVAQATETLLQGFEDIVDPADLKAASPDGWHSDGTTNTTETFGNNVLTYTAIPEVFGIRWV